MKNGVHFRMGLQWDIEDTSNISFWEAPKYDLRGTLEFGSKEALECGSKGKILDGL